MPVRSQTWCPGRGREWGQEPGFPRNLQIGSVAGLPGTHSFFSESPRRGGETRWEPDWLRCDPDWNLPESGGGRQCLFSRPVSLGHVFGVVVPASADGTSLQHQRTPSTFPLSGLLRRGERKSESFPSSTYSFCFFQILTDDETIRIRPLLAKSNHPPTEPLKYTRASGIAGDHLT